MALYIFVNDSALLAPSFTSQGLPTVPAGVPVLTEPLVHFQYVPSIWIVLVVAIVPETVRWPMA